MARNDSSISNQGMAEITELFLSVFSCLLKHVKTVRRDFRSECWKLREDGSILLARSGGANSLVVSLPWGHSKGVLFLRLEYTKG